MRMFLVARRDSAGFLTSVWGLAVLTAAITADGIWFLALGRGASAEYSADVIARFFLVHGVVSLVLTALLGVRGFAEERTNGSWVLLRASPLSDRDITFGKYFGVMALSVVFSAFTVHIPAMVMFHGRVSAMHLAVGYAGVLGLSSVGAAVGLWASSFTQRQVFAAFLAAVTLFPFVGASLVSRVVDPPFRGVGAYASIVQRHLKTWNEGQANTETVILLGTLTFVFLLMATQSLCARRMA